MQEGLQKEELTIKANAVEEIAEIDFGKFLFFCKTIDDPCFLMEAFESLLHFFEFFGYSRQA